MDGADGYNVSSRAVILTILKVEDVEGGNTGKVADVQAVPHGNLSIIILLDTDNISLFSKNL